jgi:nanoRNase/pAp phosphatase (c-di-AMP/oligoRNAs hydrolase)
MVEVLGIELTAFEDLDLRRFDLVALVDTQPRSGNNSLPSGVAPDVVIDHHPARADLDSIPWLDIQPGLGASSTIVFRYLKQKKVDIDARLATCFLYALKSETRDLGREATSAERHAYVELVGKADHDALSAIINPKLPREHFAALDRAIRSAQMMGDLLAVNLGQLHYPDLVAEIADLMLSFDRARWVVCVGIYHQTLYLSLRTERVDARAGELIRRVVGARGAAGGHGMIAGGRLYARVPDERALGPLYEQIVRKVQKELGIRKRRSIPLLAGR